MQVVRSVVRDILPGRVGVGSNVLTSVGGSVAIRGAEVRLTFVLVGQSSK